MNEALDTKDLNLKLLRYDKLKPLGGGERKKEKLKPREADL